MNKKWFYLFFIAIGLLIGFYFYNKYNVAPNIDFNKLNLVDLQENPFKIDSLKGKKIIVCFSASWCPNCLKELKDINEVKNTELANIEILVISDESIEKINLFKQKTNYPFTFLKLKQPFNEIGIFSIPTSYIVNTQLEVKKETVGYLNWKDPSTAHHLKKLME